MSSLENFHTFSDRLSMLCSHHEGSSMVGEKCIIPSEKMLTWKYSQETYCPSLVENDDRFAGRLVTAPSESEWKLFWRRFDDLIIQRTAFHIGMTL